MKDTTWKGIWVFAELEDGAVSETVLELLGKARDLKQQLGGSDPVVAVLLGNDKKALQETLFSYGAEEVLLARSPVLAAYSCRPYQKALAQLVKKYQPSIFLFPASFIGRELAPRLMCDLNTGLTADAIDLLVDEDGCFVQTTPAYGGKFQAHIAIPECRPQMVTVRPHVFPVREPEREACGKLTVEDLSVEADDCYVVEAVCEEVPEERPVTQAEVLVSGGRGIQQEADLDLLRELAGLIGGNIACSRPLTDCGWLAHDRQLGQSGSTVSPKYIINVGISGSVQYVSGVKNAECIITVNHDDTAPLFEMSDVGIVADYRVFLPAVLKEIRRRRAL